MRRSGIGLRSLIALNLLVVLSGFAGVMTYTAARLLRHGLVQDQIQSDRGFLQRAAERLSRRCPELIDRRSCARMTEWQAEMKDFWPALRSLTIADDKGKVVLSSDPQQTADALWGEFGPGAQSADEAGKPWRIQERKGRRAVLISTRLPWPGWRLSGSFSLESSDLAAWRVAHILLLYAALLVLAGVFAGWVLLQRLIVRPLDRLLQSTDRIAEGDLTFLMAEDSGSELGRLGSSLSRMVNRIKEDKGKLEHQIEELTRLNQELGQAQQSLIRSEKLASVGKLAAGVAHEVGNPISAILGFVGMLRTEEIPEDQEQDILARVESEVERIDTVIKDLLAYSRPNRSDVLVVGPTDLVENAMILIRPQKKFKQLAFSVEIPADLPWVLTDAELIRQVLVNLMLNALDAVTAGGHVWVRAALLELDPDGSLRWDGGDDQPAFFSQGAVHQIVPPSDSKMLIPGKPAVVFSVVDDGEGIAAQDLGHIFDPFFTTKDRGQGTGLGLAICHSAISAMEGDIWAHSPAGQGAQISFHLPVAPKMES